MPNGALRARKGQTTKQWAAPRIITLRHEAETAQTEHGNRTQSQETSAIAEKSALFAFMLTRWPACSLAVLRLGLFCGGNSAGWRLGSGPGADFRAVLDRDGDGQVPGPRVG